MLFWERIIGCHILCHTASESSEKFCEVLRSFCCSHNEKPTQESMKALQQYGTSPKQHFIYMTCQASPSRSCVNCSKHVQPHYSTVSAGACGQACDLQEVNYTCLAVTLHSVVQSTRRTLLSTWPYKQPLDMSILAFSAY